MNIDEMYITHYREPGREIIASITRLEKDNAFALAFAMSKSCQSKRNRFCEADFPGYYEKRMRVEEWLYAEFTRLGGKPKTRHPLYFVLGECAYLRDWFGRGEETRLPLAGIPDTAISFTVCDSMNDKNAPGVGKVYTKRALNDLICTYARAEDFFADIEKNHFYVEAQLWDDQCLSGEGVGVYVL